MEEVLQALLRVATEAWGTLSVGLIIILSLVMLAQAIRATMATGMGSGSGLAQALLGMLGPVAAALFLFLGVPPLVHSITTISACAPELADLTLWAQRLLAVIIAFRMLKVGYLAIVAEALGTGEAVVTLLNEAAAVVAAMLVIPFISGVAAGLLGC